MKPACSACWTSRRSRPGAICSWEQWNPMVGIGPRNHIGGVRRGGCTRAAAVWPPVPSGSGRPRGPAVGRSRHGAPRGRCRRRGLGHGRRDDRVGAGRGAAWTCWSSSAASDCPASRRTGRRTRCSCGAATSRPSCGRTGRGRVRAGRALRRRAATPRSTVRRCPGSGSRTSRRWRTSTGSRPRGRSGTPTSSPSTARPSACTPCTARTGEDPTEPWRSTPFPYAALPHEPYVAALVERLTRRRGEPGLDGDGGRPAAGWAVRAVRDVRRLPVPARRQVGCRGVRRRPRARDRVGPVGDRGAGGAAGHRRARGGAWWRRSGSGRTGR